jgi:CHAT domain-containing protein
VLVPAGALHALPWAVLPSCRGRAVSVAPSATTWLTATRTNPAPARGTVLVAGPDLAHAEAEVLALRETRASVLTAERATAEAVLAAVDGAALAHLATHGEFRADNPMFSHIRLHDGPLTVYDLQRLRRPPAVVVLSACDSGLSAVRPGEELMGLTAALLGLGTGTVVGSVLPADDAATRSLMLDLYGRLRSGAGTAAALAAAQSTVDAPVFCCFGAG